MKQLIDKFLFFYNKIVLGRPLIVILCLVVILSFLGYQARKFRIDASTETLLLENDQDLRYSRQVYKRYGVHDFLIISYAPKDGNLLSDKTLENIALLRDDLKKLKSVSSVLTMIDVPLLESPPVSYKELSENIPNLESPKIDRELARTELKNSPFYGNMLVSKDMTTTAILVYLHPDKVYAELLSQRSTYNEKRADGSVLSGHEQNELDKIAQKIDQRMEYLNKAQHQNIANVRSIMDKYRGGSELFLGGISMAADDMITFIKTDLKIFGIGVFLLLILMLGLIFRRIRWIILPMLCCFLAVTAMMGILGIFGWEVTVISSNFISLQLIITLALVIHLMVRYRELHRMHPDADQYFLVSETVRTKFTPSLYAVLTTVAGFSSLLFCDILPVINFGWMMSAGIIVSLTLTFTIFPAGVLLMKKEPPAVNKTSPQSDSGLEKESKGFSFTGAVAKFTEAYGRLIMVVAMLLLVFSVAGIARLEVENSFIDYFKKSTEIYQGMEIIDRKLGGTTPLDIIIEFEDAAVENPDEETADEDDDFLDAFGEEEEDTDKYWFTDQKMAVAEQVHDYLTGLEATGKVLSLGTVLKIARRLNEGKTLDSYELSILYTKLPNDLKKVILDPYVSIENNEIRFFIRIIDSLEHLRRDALLKQIKHDLVHKLGLKPDKVHLAGTMVLYNNMLQSLFRSQILTLGFVALALLIMFLILFRSVKLALIALFPNLLSSGFVLGVMGWLNIPLDMMTITIAAISIGIAVDNTIHYIDRFKREIETDHDYYKTLHRCHNSIAHAMTYSAMTVIIGFSILVFSNFYPTIYFGLFTGLAMFIALAASLTLLPELIILIKPFGSEKTIP